MRFFDFLFRVRMRRYYEKYYMRKEWKYGVPDIIVGPSGMTGYYQMVIPFATIILTIVLILLTIGVGIFCIVMPPQTVEEMRSFQTILLILFAFFLGIQVLKIMELMFIHNGYCLYTEFILIRKIGRTSKKVTYEEMKEVLKRKKMKMRRGCFLIPTPRGRMKIKCGHSEDDTIDMVVRYLNRHGKLSLPMPTWEDKVRVRRSGLLPVINKANLFLWIMDLFFIFVVFVSGEEQGTFWQIYFPSNIAAFAKNHFMLWLVVIGYLFVIYITVDDLFFRFLRFIGVIPKKSLPKKRWNR